MTGIRHWSTPDYTRVAIDLEQDVKFESQRIAIPTASSSTCRYQAGLHAGGQDLRRRRRVPEENPGGAVSAGTHARGAGSRRSLRLRAFLLPNPSRLIIDIHGKTGDKHASEADDRRSGNVRRSAAAGETEAHAATDDCGLNARSSAARRRTRFAARGAKMAPSRRSSGRRREGQARAPKKRIVEAGDDDERVGPRAKLDSAEITDDSRSTATSCRTDTAAKSSSPSASNVASECKSQQMTRDRIPRSPAHGQRRPFADPRAWAEDRQDRHRSRPRRARYRHHRAQRSAGERSGARRWPAPGQAARDPPGRGSGLHAQRRHFYSARNRTAIANQEQADLFISIHANSSRDPDARGVETYYLNFTSSPDALEVAARENAVSEKSIHELQDLVKKIALKEKIEESREFAADVQQSLHSGLPRKPAFAIAA